MAQKFYEKIKWLENIGKKEVIDTTISNKQIFNIKDVEKYIKTVLWGNLLLEAQNELSIYLVDNNFDDSKWNIYAQNAKKIYLKKIEPIIITGKIKKEFYEKNKNRIAYNFILIYLLNSYFDKVTEYCFLKDILKVYEAGHLPCGWIGPVEEKEIPTIEESIRAVYSSDIDETYKKGTLLYY